MKHSQSLLDLLTIGNWTTFDLVTLSGQNHDEEKMARELVNLLCEVQCSSETTAGIFEWCCHESNQSLVPKHNRYLFTHNWSAFQNPNTWRIDSLVLDLHGRNYQVEQWPHIVRHGGGLDGKFCYQVLGNLVMYFPSCSLTLNFLQSQQQNLYKTWLWRGLCEGHLQTGDWWSSCIQVL